MDCKEINELILKEINSEYALEGLVLKQKLQYFCLPDTKSRLIGKAHDAEKDCKQEEKEIRG